MKKISLTQGKFTLVDDEDFEWLNKWKWHTIVTQDGNWYAKNTQSIYMHRLILNIQNKPKNVYADHKNGNGLDNRRENLRIATNQLNQANEKLSKNSTSGYKGVTWHKKNKNWNAQIMVNRKHIHIGCYQTKEEAAKAHDSVAKKHFGEFARLNFSF